MYKKIILCFATLIASLAVGSSCSAVNSVQISPLRQDLVLEHGAVNDYSFFVKNSGDNSFKIKVYASAFTLTDEDYNFSFGESDSIYSLLQRWIAFRDESGNYAESAIFEIPAGEEREIFYRVTVPESTPSGGQYSIIFVETINEGDSGVKISTREAIIISGKTTGETIRAFEWLDFGHVPGYLMNGKISGTANIKNAGNIDFTSVSSLTVRNIFGQIIYEKTGYAENIYPETNHKISLEWEDTPTFGLFSVTYEVKVLDDIRTETKLVLVYPFWLIIVTLMLLTIIIMWVIITIKKRKGRRSRFSL